MAKHYFGSTIYDKFHHNWYRFQVECGIDVCREERGQKMISITNKKSEVTCKNCLRMMKRVSEV